MNKGFTLIELLIVMVVVGVLVTVSLPKYRASMERGRAMEGITNLRAISDAANARYVMNNNSYPSDGWDSSVGDLTKRMHFGSVSMYESSANEIVFYTDRETGDYELYAINQNGELKRIECAGDSESCLNIGMDDASGGKYSDMMMDFTK